MPEQVGLFDAIYAEQDAVEKETKRDKVGERLVALGYCTDYCLHLNAHLGAWGAFSGDQYPWNLPSRTMQWPIEICQYDRESDYCSDKVTDTLIGLVHPLLAEHPLALKLKADGFEVVEDGVLYDTMRGDWGHACDLATDEHWEALIDTRRFTSSPAIFNAIAFRATHRSGKKLVLSIKSARAIMAALESVEPTDRLAGIMEFSKPNPIREDKKATRWPINANLQDKEAEAWAIIHGIEDELFAFHGDFLGWSPKGCNMRGVPQQQSRI